MFNIEWKSTGVFALKRNPPIKPLTHQSHVGAGYFAAQLAGVMAA